MQHVTSNDVIRKCILTAFWHGSLKNKSFSGLQVFRHVASNPLFFMTVIGVVFNFILKHQLPVMVEGFFKDLGKLIPLFICSYPNDTLN